MTAVEVSRIGVGGVRARSSLAGSVGYVTLVLEHLSQGIGCRRRLNNGVSCQCNVHTPAGDSTRQCVAPSTALRNVGVRSWALHPHIPVSALPQG